MTRTIQEANLKPGDIIVFLGRPHLIAAIQPYHHPTLGPARMARGSEGWNITLFPGDTVDVETIE